MARNRLDLPPRVLAASPFSILAVQRPDTFPDTSGEGCTTLQPYRKLLVSPIMSTPRSARPTSSHRSSYGTEMFSGPSPITPRRTALLFLSFATLTLALLLLPTALRQQSPGDDNGGVPALPGIQVGSGVAGGGNWNSQKSAPLLEWEMLANAPSLGGDALAVGATSFFASLGRSIEATVDRIGDTILAWLGLDEESEAGAAKKGGSLAGWGESSVYVEVCTRIRYPESELTPQLAAHQLLAPLTPILFRSAHRRRASPRSPLPHHRLLVLRLVRLRTLYHSQQLPSYSSRAVDRRLPAWTLPLLAEGPVRNGARSVGDAVRGSVGGRG